MSFSSIKQAFSESVKKSKELDEMNNWFISLSYERKKDIYKQGSIEKGICQVCKVSVNKNFIYCKDHYSPTKRINNTN